MAHWMRLELFGFSMLLLGQFVWAAEPDGQLHHRIGMLEFRPGSEVLSLSHSSDGKSIISRGVASISIWNSEKGILEKELVANTSAFTAISCPSRFGRLATAESSGEIRVFDLLKSSDQTFPARDSLVMSLAFFPDGNILLSGHKDGDILLWDMSNSTAFSRVDHGSSVSNLVVSTDGKSFASQSEKTIQIWNSASRKIKSTLHLNGLRWVAISPNLKYALSRARGNEIHLWDVSNERVVQKYPVNPAGGKCAAFDSTSKLIAFSDSTSVRIVNLDRGTERALGPFPTAPTALAFSLDASSLAVSHGLSGAIDVFSVSSGKKRHEHENSSAVSSAQFSPDEKFLAVGSEDGILRIYEAGSWDIKARHGDHELGVLSVGYSESGALMSLEGSGRRLRIWDQNSRLSVIRPTEDRMTCAAISPNGERVAVGVANAKTTNGVILWDVEKKRDSGSLPHSWVSGLTFLNDDALVSAGPDYLNRDSRAFLRVWDLSTGLVRMNASPDGNGFLRTLSANPRISVIAGCGDDSRVKFWLLNSGKLLRFKSDSVGFSCVTISRNGAYAAGGTNDGRILVWRKDGRLVRTFKAHSGRVTCLQFFGNCRRLVSGSTDSTVAIWGLTESEPNNPGASR